MKVYKILHKPTGLFYCPNNGLGNLSITGKIYAKKPSMHSNIRDGVRVHIIWSELDKLTKKEKILIDYFKPELYNTDKKYINVDKYYNIPDEDWEILEL